MSILSVDQIQPIGSGTTITLNATEVKTGTEITVGTGASIFSPAGNTLTFGTNNVERIRIKNDGKVGIGTNNPTAKLEIKGSDNPLVKIVQDTSGIARLNLESATNDGYQYSGIGLGDGTNDAELMWTTQGFDINVGNSVRFRILSNGHIAIGHDIANDTGMFKVEAADGQADDQYVGQFKNHEATASRNYGLLVQAGSNSTDHGLRVRNGANNATHFEVRGDGYITTPSQVGCAVRMSSHFTHPGNNSFNSGTSWVMPFDTEVWDIGSNFNTSNYTFTAPIAGRYLCCYTIQIESISNWLWNYVYPVVTGTGGNSNTVATNNAGVAFADDAGNGINGNNRTIAQYHAFTNTCVMNLTAGQDVRMGTRGDLTATYKGSVETQWTMQLLG